VLAIKIIIGIGAVVLYSQLTYTKSIGFLLSRSDIIILVLANVALFGSIIWLFTKDNLLIRLSILAFLLAFRITHNIEGSWTGWIWNLTPSPEIYKFYFLQYLFIVIPGTIAGDLFYKWMKSSTEDSSDNKSNYTYLFLICMGIIVLNLFGLYSRYLTLNIFGNLIFLSAGLFLLKNSKSQLLDLCKKLFLWGTFWLLLGLSFESFEGGIKKDHPTLSYYLVTSGLAFMALISFSIISDYWKKSKYVNLLIENGQNPMIAYIAGSNFVMPILALTGLSTFLNYMLINPWLGFLKGLIFTLLAALVTSFFTKKKIFWRS
jgi:hypothetical protein